MNYKIRNSILFLLFAFSVSSYADDEKLVPVNYSTVEHIKIFDSIKLNLKDPSSLIVRKEIMNYKGNGMLKACWEISAKNSYGGYGDSEIVYVAYFGETPPSNSFVVFGESAVGMCKSILE